jgi:hypothetical protein
MLDCSFNLVLIAHGALAWRLFDRPNDGIVFVWWTNIKRIEWSMVMTTTQVSLRICLTIC